MTYKEKLELLISLEGHCARVKELFCDICPLQIGTETESKCSIPIVLYRNPETRAKARLRFAKEKLKEIKKLEFLEGL